MTESNVSAERLKHLLANPEHINPRYELSAIITLALEALALRTPSEGEADFYALHSPTRMHIGLWPKRVDAEQAAKEYENCTMTPLYRNPQLSPARLAFLYALLGAEQWVEAGQIWDQNPEEREAAYAEVRATLSTLSPGKE